MTIEENRHTIQIMQRERKTHTLSVWLQTANLPFSLFYYFTTKPIELLAPVHTRFTAKFPAQCYYKLVFHAFFQASDVLDEDNRCSR